jgi:hypothetical protein
MTIALHTATARVVAALPGASGMVAAVPTHPAMAQANPTLTNVIPSSESATIQARIAAIETATRTVTLKGASGSAVSLVAGPAVRLKMLKAGDIVNAQYYRSVGFMVVPTQGGDGTPTAPADQTAAVMAQRAQAPAASV